MTASELSNAIDSMEGSTAPEGTYGRDQDLVIEAARAFLALLEAIEA